MFCCCCVLSRLDATELVRTFTIGQSCLHNTQYPTVNGPEECREVAFIGEDKHLTCSYNATRSADACESYDSSNAISRGGTISWCVQYGSIECLSFNGSSSDNNVTINGTLFSINDAGILYIPFVSSAMRSLNGRSNVNCSIFNSNNQLCSQEGLNLLISPIGEFHV